MGGSEGADQDWGIEEEAQRGEGEEVMSVKIEQKIEFAGDIKWVITDEEKLGHSNCDEGEIVRGYIECDDVLLDGESMRKVAESMNPSLCLTDASKAANEEKRAKIISEQGYYEVDPSRPIRFEFWQGELAEIIKQQNE